MTKSVKGIHKAEIATEQEYIKKARNIFDSLKYLGSGGATMKQVIDEFDRLGVARTGITFAAVLSEAMDKGFEIRNETIPNSTDPT